jgi:peptidoglycan/LPS O-acetylase OafA/YrhL
LAGPFSTDPDLARGYVTLYMPFLFVGACVYLYEQRLASRLATLGCSAYVVISYLVLLPSINRVFADAHFAAYAVAIFLTAWRFRERLGPSRLLTFTSELTYSVYLFHNWIWLYLGQALSALTPDGGASKTATLVALLGLSALTYQLVEKPFMRIGARLAGRFH